MKKLFLIAIPCILLSGCGASVDWGQVKRQGCFAARVTLNHICPLEQSSGGEK